MSTAPSEFTLTVDGIGAFTFARRNMRRELSIGAEYSRIIEGVPTPTPWLDTIAGWISALKVLTLKAPEGWDIDELDPLDDESYSKLLKVHAALRAKEGSFRRKSDEKIETGGSGNGNIDGILVQAAVQPSAD
jgi:hypothetical protein